MGTSRDIVDQGSTFKSYAVSVSSLAEVNHGINLITTMPDVSSATHLIYSYRFKDDHGKITENFQSDGDHGLGLESLKYLRMHTKKNILVVTTRHCTPNFVHLGRTRFQYVTETAKQALENIQ